MSCASFQGEEKAAPPPVLHFGAGRLVWVEIDYM